MKFGVKGAITVTMAAALLASTSMSFASSHAEAPGITESPKLDATDLYMFRSYEPERDDFVTFIANYQPEQSPYGGPNYFTQDPDAIYEIHVDNDGDAIEDLTFQFNFDNNLTNEGDGLELNIDGQQIAIALRADGPVTEFNDENLNETESYTVELIRGDKRRGARSKITEAGGDEDFRKPLDNIGTKTLPDYRAYSQQFIYDIDIPDCEDGGRVFVGQRAEAFAVNLGEIFDLVNLVPVEIGFLAPGVGIEQDRANDDLVGEANVTSYALEVPISCLVGDGNGVIGAWTTSSLPQAQIEDPSPTYEQTTLFGAAYVQQSRLSAPLVNEIVIGLRDKDLFNASEPVLDGSAFLKYVTNPTIPAILNVLFLDAVNDITGGNFTNLAPQNYPRNDLVATFLTGFEGLNQQMKITGSEMMRLNTAVPVTPRDEQSNFGVVAEDLAGFPNGRRPGDDVVDIALRVAMGALCHPVPLGAELTLPDAVEDTPTDLVNLGFCADTDAQVGFVPFTDGAPISAAELQNEFPYLNDPLPGAGGAQ